MKYKDFIALGVDGVYRADLDEWFPVGEEPSATVNTPTPLTPEPELKPEPVVVESVKPEPRTKVKVEKGDKDV